MIFLGNLLKGTFPAIYLSHSCLSSYLTSLIVSLLICLFPLFSPSLSMTLVTIYLIRVILNNLLLITFNVLVNFSFIFFLCHHRGFLITSPFQDSYTFTIYPYFATKQSTLSLSFNTTHLSALKLFSFGKNSDNSMDCLGSWKY